MSTALKIACNLRFKYINLTNGLFSEILVRNQEPYIAKMQHTEKTDKKKKQANDSQNIAQTK